MIDCAQKALSAAEDVIITEQPLRMCTDCPLSSQYEGRAALTVRLNYEEKVLGLLSVSLPKDFAADEEEVGLFREMAGDVAFGVYAIDLEEQHRKADMALEASEERYRGLVESLSDLVLIVDPNGSFTYLNPEFEKITGYSPRDFIGRSFTEILAPEYVESTIKRFKRGLAGEKIPVYEVEILHKDGGKIPLELNVTSLLDSEGNAVGRIGVGRDLSERKILESQLQEAQKMEAIGTLAGGIAHDFNNILGAIIGHAEIGKMKLPKENEVVANLDEVVKAGNRAAKLVKQILTVSRQHQQERRPVQIRYIVEEALKLLRATLPTTIEIKKDLVKKSDIVHADPTQIHQVVMNLCTNAGHAMQDDGGVLTAELANVELDDLEAARHLDLTAGSYLRLTVSDTGHGMSPEIIERIFDPYFTTKDTGEGTGLGLSVAQGIVKTHGGTITVYSEMGKGTTFHVYLPIIDEAEEAEKEESKGPLPTGSERILFIDDEDVLVEIGSQMLEQLGYEVVTKKSSIEALELFRAEPDRFDLVITDMTMPHMTGDKLARELMKIRPDIPVILCTGHSRLVSEAKAKEIGIRAFVMKPLVMRNLAETVRKVLDL